jgi:hypothetical protein
MTLGLGFNAKNEDINGWRKGWTWLKLNEKIGWKKNQPRLFSKVPHTSLGRVFIFLNLIYIPCQLGIQGYHKSLYLVG